LKPCEFRRFDGQWICDAAGLPLTDLAAPGEPVETVCAACHVPDELGRRPCLFTTPVKVRHVGAWRDLFACHWYHAICRDDVLNSTALCGGCPDWFPRPPRDLIPGLPERTAAMRDAMERRLREPARSGPSRSAADRAEPGRGRRLWRRLVGARS
jgi:hypothetical protein